MDAPIVQDESALPGNVAEDVCIELIQSFLLIGMYTWATFYASVGHAIQSGDIGYHAVNSPNILELLKPLQNNFFVAFAAGPSGLLREGAAADVDAKLGSFILIF